MDRGDGHQPGWCLMGEATERLVRLTRVVVPPHPRRVSGKTIMVEGYTYETGSPRARMLASLTRKHAGYSIGLTGEKPKSGYMVSLAGSETQIPMKDFRSRMIQEHEEKHAEELAPPTRFSGGWVEGRTIYLDVSENPQRWSEAVRMLRDNQQLAMFDVNRDKVVTNVTAEAITAGVGLSEADEAKRTPYVVLPKGDPKRAFQMLREAALAAGITDFPEDDD